MQNRLGLHDLGFWRLKLGLLPIPLFDDEEPGQRYVLLNGTQGNFCLDLTNQPLGSEARSMAWSSNVGHYVALLNGDISIQRWDKRGSYTRHFKGADVFDNPEKFHSYLEKDEPYRTLSIVAHVIRVFRSLRAAIGPLSGADSLKAFLCLIACAADKVDRRELQLNKWRLPSEAGAVAANIRNGDWDALLEDLFFGRTADDLQPDLTLVLRHSSGQIFQEAHYEVTSIPRAQPTFEGFLPKPADLETQTSAVGLHFTPSALARTVVEEALGAFPALPQNIIIFDPACGSGEFLREALRQLTLLGYTGNIKLIGWDISDAACQMAAFALAWEERSHQHQLDVELRCANSLDPDEKWPEGVSMILMNPPFVSWKNMKEMQRESVIAALEGLSKQTPDMSSAFVWKAVAHLPNGGVLGTVLPSSFLDGDSLEGIREKLSESLFPRLIARLGNHLLFSNAMVDASLYVGTVSVRAESPIVFWADYRASSTSAGLRALRRIRGMKPQVALPELGDGYSIYVNNELGRGGKSWTPRPFKSWNLLRLLENRVPKVGDMFYVRMGIRSGQNKAFIVAKDYWESLPKAEQRFFRPAVVNESITGGVLKDSAYIFYPYGRSRLDTEAELAKRVSTYYADRLLPAKESLLKRASRRSSEWWELSEHRAWIVEHSVAKLVSTYFGDQGSFGWDGKGTYVVVQGFGWLPKSDNAFSPWSHRLGLAYLTVLNSPLFSKLLSATSNHVGGGQWNLSKKFVNDIPIPNLLSDRADALLVSELAGLGGLICEGQPFDPRRRDEIVRAAYGLDAEV